VKAHRVHPIEFEVFKNLFLSIAEEMGVTLCRTGFSPNIKERLDYSCAVYDAAGETVAQGDHMPVHLGAMPLSVRAAIDAVEMEPGDTVILNDPFQGGTHLPQRLAGFRARLRQPGKLGPQRRQLFVGTLAQCRELSVGTLAQCRQLFAGALAQRRQRAAAVGQPPRQPFGACPLGVPLAGQPGFGLAKPFALAAQRRHQAEIKHLHNARAIANQIRRFHIPMDESRCVCVSQSASCVAHRTTRLRDWHRTIEQQRR